MNSRVAIDLEDLEYFIGTLQSFNGDLEAQWGTLKSRWQASSESWQDIKREQFAEAVGWDEVTNMMEGYLATSEQYTSFLKKIYERAREYLDA